MLWVLGLTATLAGPPAADEPPPPEPASARTTVRASRVRPDPDHVPEDDGAYVEPEDPGLVVVRTRRQVRSPCRRLLDSRDVRELPVRGPVQLLQAVPGLTQTSRLGLGSPPLTSWRGMVSGVGADVAVELEGVPLNEPGHVGGHGLVDGWSLPMGLVSSVEWCPGASLPDSGPFTVGGRATLRLGRPFPGWWGEVGGGTDGSGRVALRWAPARRDAGTFIHAEVDGGEGVGADRGWRHLRLAAGITGSLDTVDLAAFLLAYDGGDDVNPLLREDDVLQGRLRFYGGYRDWTGQRNSRRMLLGTRLVHAAPWGGIRAVAWAGLRGWRLIDDPTGFLRDPVDGDGTEIRHAGQETGARLDVTRRWVWLEDESRLEGGASLQGWFARHRGHDVDLLNARTRDTLDAQLGTVALAAWTRARLGLFGVAALKPGLRVEQVEIRHLDRAEDQATPLRGGRLMVRPDVTLELSPSPFVDGHLSWGRGGRPPDPRLLPTDPTPAAEILDVFDSRVSARPIDALELGLTTFAMFGREETLIDPVLFQPLFTAPTRRTGGELSFVVIPPGLPGEVPLRLGADLSFADARRTDTGELLPYAPRWSGAVHATVRRWNLSTPRVQDLYLGLGVRFQWVGRYPLPDDFTARGFSATDIRVNLDWRKWTFQLDLDNAIPWHWRQIEAFLPSRWDLARPGTELPVRHLVAGRPFALRFAVSWRF